MSDTGGGWGAVLGSSSPGGPGGVGGAGGGGTQGPLFSYRFPPKESGAVGPRFKIQIKMNVLFKTL